MSRGPGLRQRKILDRLTAADGKGIYVSPINVSPSEGASLRRAAYKLDAAGTIAVRTHKGRLVAYWPDTAGLADDRVTVGSDGRFYRSKYGELREDEIDRLEEEKTTQAFLDRYNLIAERHGHPHGPGILLCIECAKEAGADDELLEKIRAMAEHITLES